MVFSVMSYYCSLQGLRSFVVLLLYTLSLCCKIGPHGRMMKWVFDLFYVRAMSKDFLVTYVFGEYLEMT